MLKEMGLLVAKTMPFKPPMVITLAGGLWHCSTHKKKKKKRIFWGCVLGGFPFFLDHPDCGGIVLGVVRKFQFSQEKKYPWNS